VRIKKGKRLYSKQEGGKTESLQKRVGKTRKRRVTQKPWKKGENLRIKDSFNQGKGVGHSDPHKRQLSFLPLRRREGNVSKEQSNIRKKES